MMMTSLLQIPNLEHWLSTSLAALSAPFRFMQGIHPTTWILRILSVLLALSLHEAAHAWMAARLGDTTAEEAGRVTLNPLRHLDPIGALFILLGAPVGWAKPVPFNPHRFRANVPLKRGLALVSIAGVAANFLLAVISRFALLVCQLIFYGLTSRGFVVSVQMVFIELFSMLFYINLYLLVFNLLPVPPLDGFKFFGTLLPRQIYDKILQYERYIGIAFLLLICFGRNILWHLLSFIANPLVLFIDLPIRLLGKMLIQVFYG